MALAFCHHLLARQALEELAFALRLLELLVLAAPVSFRRLPEYQVLVVLEFCLLLPEYPAQEEVLAQVLARAQAEVLVEALAVLAQVPAAVQAEQELAPEFFQLSLNFPCSRFPFVHKFDFRFLQKSHVCI